MFLQVKLKPMQVHPMYLNSTWFEYTMKGVCCQHTQKDYSLHFYTSGGSLKPSDDPKQEVSNLKVQWYIQKCVTYVFLHYLYSTLIANMLEENLYQLYMYAYHVLYAMFVD